jgi:uncharacterized membrane protein YbhN (UPF0104 family)
MGRHAIAIFLLTGAAVSVGTIAGVMYVAGFGPTWHALLGADWKWLALAPVGIAVSHVGYMFAYREVARLGGGPEIRHGQVVVLVATGFGPFNPRGGFASDATSLGDLGLDQEGVWLRVIMLAVLEYAVLAPAAFGAALVMYLHHQKAQAGLLPSWILGVPAGALVTLGLAAVRWRGRSLGKGIDRFLDGIGTTISMLARWPWGTLGWAGMVLYWAGEIAALGGCLAVFEPRRIGNAALILAYATGYALTRRTLPLAGAGAVEAIMPFALTWLYYPLPAAVLTVIAYRIFNLWLTMPPAAASLRHLRRQQARRTTNRSLASVPASST